MKNAPCARLGIRIRPKISEKPDDSRNNRPPKATLFSVWMIQNCHCMLAFARWQIPVLAAVTAGRGPAALLFRKRSTPRSSPGGDGWGARPAEKLHLQILRRRIVARIDRVSEEFVLLVGPELADVGIGLDHRVDVAAVLLLDLADIRITDDVAELVEPHRTAQGVRPLRAAQRLDEGVLVLGLAADRF